MRGIKQLCVVIESNRFNLLRGGETCASDSQKQTRPEDEAIIMRDSARW